MRISDWSSDVCSSDLRSGGSDIGTAGLPELATWHTSPQMIIMTGTNQREDGGRNDQLRLFLLGLGIFLILMAPVVGILPGPGGMLVLAAGLRSEEHTSELQSLMRISYAVFCLKKKQTKDKTK